MSLSKNRLMLGAALAAALLITPLDADAAIQTSAVVKTRSSDSGANSLREGSGLLFSHGSEIYVLSSDHVLFRENGEYVHHVSNSAWGKLKATYIFADWGRGISLLKVDSPPAKMIDAVPKFSDLEAAEQVDSVPAITYGYPAQTDTLIQHDQGVAQHPLSKFDIMASAKKMAFLQGGYAEFGMSGGPVFLKDGRFLGVLSHILFWPKNGKTDDWTGQPDATDAYVLVVPFGEIKETLTDYLVKKSLEKVVWVESNEGVQPKQTKVRCSRLEFDSKRDKQGFLISIDVSYLAEKASHTCPNEARNRDPYPQLEEILSKQAPDARKAVVAGLRMEKVFKFGTFMQIDLPNFHAFAVSIQWSNIRAVFQFAKPETAVLKKTLTGYVSDLDTLLAHKATSAHWKERLTELKQSFQLTLEKPDESRQWMAAHPGGIDEVLRYAQWGNEKPSPQTQKFLDKVRAFTAKYLY